MTNDVGKIVAYMKSQNDHCVSSAEELSQTMNAANKEASINSLLYYVLKEEGLDWVVTNVPKVFYERVDIKRYLPPVSVSGDNEAVFAELKQNIDANAVALKLKPNNCFDNSYRIYELSCELIRSGCEISPAKPVLGYISQKILLGTEVGDKLIWHGGVRIHDLHAWNYLNGLLIDVTKFARVDVDSTVNFATLWGKADDHVFMYLPKDTEYFGVEFDEVEAYKKSCLSYVVR